MKSEREREAATVTDRSGERDRWAGEERTVIYANVRSVMPAESTVDLDEHANLVASIVYNAELAEPADSFRAFADHAARYADQLKGDIAP